MLFALAVDGEAGVRNALQMLKDELEVAMALCGCPSLKDITRGLTKLTRAGLLNAMVSARVTVAWIQKFRVSDIQCPESETPAVVVAACDGSV